MRIWSLLAVAVALLAGLGMYRVVTLEQRIDALSARLGHAPPVARETGNNQTLGLEQRLSRLEAEVASLRRDLHAFEQGDDLAVAAKPNTTKSLPEDQILSVVGRAQNRVRDRQLQFHRDRWLEWREDALDQFAQHFGLTTWQTQKLHELLAQEVDTMVEIMRRPDTLENPEQTASDWQAKLEQTDQEVHRVLEPAQSAGWDQARAAERHTLWPWLPDK